MPSGIHNSPRGGNKPKCLCGSCYNCKQRVRNQKFRERRKGLPKIGEEELERKMIEMFSRKGWD